MRLLIISNRLPVSIHEVSQTSQRSIGGLATGVESYCRKIMKGETCFDDYLWLGWPGADIKSSQRAKMRDEYLNNYGYLPVFLDAELIESFYFEYCNNVIWPLFHNCQAFIKYNSRSWRCYQRANDAFFLSIAEVIKPEDVVWVHDYHLMVLAARIRENFRNARIIFFLHIPFPNLATFRQLPKVEQEDILIGMLSADVIGFHTQGYANEFLNCLYHVLGITGDHGVIQYGGRLIKVDVFPMGIDYSMVRDLAESNACTKIRQKVLGDISQRKVVLSVDRLDYTKGIVNRLMAFYELLENYREWREQVVLMLIVAPSRREIESYQQIKKAIDEWVGKINGSFSTNDWLPVVYHYNQFDLINLCALYSISSVGLITPLCDGMNLIAKEFIASNNTEDGVLILSEMAGAAHELRECISVNPFSVPDITQAIDRALRMPSEERATRNKKMHLRIRDYNVVKWAQQMVDTLFETIASGHVHEPPFPDEAAQAKIIDSYRESRTRLVIVSSEAVMESSRNNLSLKKLGDLPENVVIIADNDRRKHDISLLETEWRSAIVSTIEKHAAKLKYSNIECKRCSIVLDVQMCETRETWLCLDELEKDLAPYLYIYPFLNVYRDRHSLIVRNIGSDDANVLFHWLSQEGCEFVLVICDSDDNDLFANMPSWAHCLRVDRNVSADQTTKLLTSLSNCMESMPAVETQRIQL